MPRMQTFEKLEQFYDVLASYQNADSYTLAAPTYAAERVGMPTASAKSALRILHGIGSIRIYVADRDQPGVVTEVIDEYIHEPNRKMMLIQLTGKAPTRELYGSYLVDSASKGLRTV